MAQTSAQSAGEPSSRHGPKATQPIIPPSTLATSSSGTPSAMDPRHIASRWSTDRDAKY